MMKKPNGYWIYERCFEEAKKYKTRTKFQKGSNGAYGVALKNGWLDDYTWFVKPSAHNKKWVRETCFEEAKKYKTRGEFQKGCGRAYYVALKNGWLDDYTWLEEVCKPKGYWIREHCFEEAKKYKTRNELQKGSGSAYIVARKNGWLDDYTWFEEAKKPNGYWTYETCFEEAKKYKTRSEFKNGSCGAYEVALKNGWLNDYDWLVYGRVKLFTDKLDSVYMYQFEDGAVYVGRTLMSRQQERHNQHLVDRLGKYAEKHNLPLPPMKIIEENLTLREGLEREDYWVNWYRNNGYKVINKAKTGIGSGSLGSINSGKWNKDACFEEAKKYKTKGEFQKGCSRAYYVALKNGWLDDYTWFEETKKPKGYWTYETCFEEAKKYKTRSKFQKGSCGAYRLALENGWLSDYIWFNEIKKPNGYWTREHCFEEAKKHKTRNELRNECGGAYDVARKNGWLDIFFPVK